VKKIFCLLALAAALPLKLGAAPAIVDGGRNILFPTPSDVLQTSATITGTNVSSVNLYINTGSGFGSAIPMTLDSGNTWKVTIPGSGTFSNGTYVKYYLEATDDTGTAVLPSGAPTAFNVFLIDSDPVGADDIVINEIMYDPTGTDNAATSSGWPEFVEFYNRRNTPVRLDYFRFSRNMTAGTADRFIFPENTEIAANSYLVITGNKERFTVRYGDPGVPVLDQGLTASWFNNTSGVAIITHANSIGFSGPTGVPFDMVSYTNGLPWPGGSGTGNENPNNTGPSIELINPILDNNVGDNWKASTLILGDRSRGTPGIQNSTFEEIELRVSNVVRSIQYPLPTDTIRITANVISENTVSQVRVIADLRNGNSFQTIATMSPIGNGNYEANIGPFPNKTVVKYFVEATDSNSTTASAPEDAPNSFNVFVVDSSPVGANEIVINEIMYDPSGSDNNPKSEWVELYNTSNQDLSLDFFQFSPRTTGFAQVLLPEGTTITANGFLILAGNKQNFLLDYPDGSLPNNIDPEKVIDLAWPASSVMANATGGDDPNMRHPNAIGYLGTANSAFDIVPYDIEGSWPGGLANDGGATIELMNPSLANNVAANWGGSDPTNAPNGTPLAHNSFLAEVGNWSLY